MMKLFKSKSGATAIEYALMIGMAAILIVTAVTTMGEKTAQSFNSVTTAL